MILVPNLKFTVMQIEDFTKKFAGAIDEDDLAAAPPHTNFRRLKSWDSMAAFSVMAMIDEEYGIALKDTEMRKTETIQQLYDLVASKSNEQ